jgi:hypothetical protein
LRDAPGDVADFSGNSRYFKLERLGYLRVVISFNPTHYTADAVKPVRVYTLTEKGADLLRLRKTS